MKKEKKVKYYNPYPFPVRMMNDLNKEQTLAPQGHGKVLKNRYTQSKIELVICDSDEKVYRTGLDIDLDKMLKSDLVDLAWALMIGDKVDDLEGMTKKELVEGIRGKVGSEDVEVEEADRTTTADPSKRPEIQEASEGIPLDDPIDEDTDGLEDGADGEEVTKEDQ